MTTDELQQYVSYVHALELVAQAARELTEDFNPASLHELGHQLRWLDRTTEVESK